MGKEGRGRKAAGGRGEKGRGEGAGAAAAAAGFPASSPRCAPRSLGRCSPRRPASPRLGLPLWPRLLPPSGPALLYPLPPAPPPPSTQIPTPHPEPRSRRRRRRRRHTALELDLARLPRWPGPPRLAPTRPLALSLLLLCQSVCRFATEAPPTLLGSSRIGAGATAPACAGWLAARDVSAPPPLVARLPPSAVQQQQNPSPQAAAALETRASPLQPPPRELVSGARGPGHRGGGRAERARGSGPGRPRGEAGGAYGAAPAPQ